MGLYRCAEPDCETLLDESLGRARCVECHRKLERASGPPKAAPQKSLDRLLREYRIGRAWVRGR